MIAEELSLQDNRSTLKIRVSYPTPKPILNPIPVPVKKVSKKQLKYLDIKQEKSYSSFQIIPHTDVKNEKVSQFADVLSDTYQELFKRFSRGSVHDPERIFFETEITHKEFKTFVTTNSDLEKAVKQQTQVIWNKITINEHAPNMEFEENKTLAYELKFKFPYFLSLRTDRKMQQIPLEELLEISRFMEEGDRGLIQFGIQSAEEGWFKEAEKQREDFERKTPKKWRRKEFHGATELKVSHFGFDFCLRVLVKSADERRQRRIARGIILSIKQLNYDNELIDKRIKPFQLKRFLGDVKKHRIHVPLFFGKRQIITGPEIAHFIKLPQKALQEEYPIIEAVSGKETTISDSLKEGGLRLGEATFKGKNEPVYMSTKNVDELCLPRVIIGSMGSGKTKGYGANFIVESVKNGYGALAIDPAKGEIGDEVSKVLPADKVVRIRLGQTPISLDWREVERSSKAKNRLANTIIGFFNSSDMEAGAQTARYLRAAVMGMKTGKLSENMRIFEDKAYLEEVIKEMPESIHKATLQSFSEEKEGRQRQILGPIYNRLDVVLGDQYLAECMESDEGIDLVELMEQKKAFIIDVPKAELGPEAVDLIVNLISTKIDLAMTLRKEENQHPFFIVFDEPHQFLKSAQTWKAAAVESRKWRVGYVWMFHSWEQIPRNLAEIIKAAGPHYHLYPSSKKTFIDLSEEISPFTIEEALKLKRFHAINILRADGGVQKPFIAKMTPPPSEQSA